MNRVTKSSLIILAIAVSACGAEDKPSNNDPHNTTNIGTSGGSNNTTGTTNTTGSNNDTTTTGGDTTLCGMREELVDLDEILREVLLDGNWVHGNSHDQDRGFALSLPATDGGHLGSATAFMPCAGAEDFDPYCEPEPETGLTKCLRIGCVDAATAYAETYFTDGSMDPAVEMPLAYNSADGAEVAFAARPIRRWEEVSATKTVSASIDASLSITRDTAIDYSHTGTVTVTGDAATGLIDLEFVDLLGDGIVTTVHIEHTDDLVGTLTHGAETITIGDLGIEWDSCE